MPPRASLIVSTFSQPHLLDLSLRSLARQSSLDFEVLVADLGAGLEVAECIRERAAGGPARIEHVPQPDGRRADALNRAVLRSRGEHLIFLSGRSIAPRGFVEAHLRARRERRYLVGGCVERSPDDPDRLDALLHRVADTVRYRIRAAGIALGWPERPATDGQSFSVDRESFFRVNGYDQSLNDAAGQDLDLRQRLQIAGLHPRPLGPAARVHLVGGELRGVRVEREEAPVTTEGGALKREAVLGLRELAESLRREVEPPASPFSSRSV
jgi:GT2 family glycosyltransferase